MKKIFALSISISLLAALLIAGFAWAGGTKVDVCHFDKDSGVFFLINISENAFDAHVAHGDAAPLEAVPGMTGWAFDGNCAPYELQTATLNVSAVQPVTVASTAFNTKVGVEYKLVATGTYKFANWATTADPELGYADARCSKRTAYYNPYGNYDGWVDGVDLGTPYGLQVSLYDGNIIPPLAPANWTPYCNDAHTYTTYITGNGLPIKLFIWDNAYGDNVGGITVNIYEQPLLP